MKETAPGTSLSFKTRREERRSSWSRGGGGEKEPAKAYEEWKRNTLFRHKTSGRPCFSLPTHIFRVSSPPENTVRKEDCCCCCCAVTQIPWFAVCCMSLLSRCFRLNKSTYIWCCLSSCCHNFAGRNFYPSNENNAGGAGKSRIYDQFSPADRLTGIFLLVKSSHFMPNSGISAFDSDFAGPLTVSPLFNKQSGSGWKKIVERSERQKVKVAQSSTIRDKRIVHAVYEGYMRARNLLFVCSCRYL